MSYTTIKKPSDFFNTKLYTGNGSTNAITGVGFQPDFTWIKSRTEGYGHSLFDAVRGVTKAIASEGTGAEYTFSTGLTAFGSDGFTLGSGTVVNNNSQNHASWNWKANGAGVANTDGSISSTVSASATSGFSIVKFTPTGSASTIGHGLGVAPKMIIVKNLGGTSTWSVYHSSLGATKFLRLEDTNAVGTGTGWWNDTAPTSSVFTLGSNINAVDTIAYCFADVQGYSKFGSYTGNGSTDGTFVYTGFSPAFVMVKRTDGANNWNIKDNRRNNASTSFNINPRNATLLPNTSDADQDANALDFLSNGFKNTSTGNDVNASGGNFIYMAFAEQPLVGDNPATAR